MGVHAAQSLAGEMEGLVLELSAKGWGLKAQEWRYTVYGAGFLV